MQPQKFLINAKIAAGTCALNAKKLVSGKLVTPTALLAYLKFVLAVRAPGRFLFTKPLGLNPNLIELNELKTRVSFFLKLDNGKYCP